MSDKDSIYLSFGTQQACAAALIRKKTFSPENRLISLKKCSSEANVNEDKFKSAQNNFFIQYTSLILILLCLLIAYSSLRAPRNIQKTSVVGSDVKYLTTEIKLKNLIVANEVDVAQLESLKEFLANHNLNLLLEIETQQNLAQASVRLAETLSSMGFWEDSFSIRSKHCLQPDNCQALAKLSWSTK